MWLRPLESSQESWRLTLYIPVWDPHSSLSLYYSSLNSKYQVTCNSWLSPPAPSALWPILSPPLANSKFQNWLAFLALYMLDDR